MTLLADVSPATLRLPDRTTKARLRVFVWPNRVEAWGIRDKEAALLCEAHVLSIDTGKSPQAPARSKPWTLLTDSGEWRVERGCTCSGQVPAALSALVPRREVPADA